MEVRTKLSPPWITFINEIKALFGSDPELTIEYSDDFGVITIHTPNEEKASAIRQLLLEEKDFGNVVIEVDVRTENNFFIENSSTKELFDIAFKDNPAYAYTKEIALPFGGTVNYVVFKNKVVQFFNDNLNDLHGLKSTLYQDIADDVLDTDSFDNTVYYCTDIEEKVENMPINWP